MESAVEKFEWMPQSRYLGPAQVLEVDNTRRRARLRLIGYPQEGHVWARIAIPGLHALQRGDMALAVGEESDELYLIGVLDKAAASVAPEKEITSGVNMALNYGLNRVRFPSAVPAETRIRSKTTLIDIKESKGGLMVTEEVVIQVEGQDRPGCVAEVITLLLF